LSPDDLLAAINRQTGGETDQELAAAIAADAGRTAATELRYVGCPQPETPDSIAINMPFDRHRIRGRGGDFHAGI
jgi:hypothetical protein